MRAAYVLGRGGKGDRGRSNSDANLLGALFVIAALPAVKKLSPRFAFGRDGGAILIPPAATRAAVEALKGANALLLSLLL